MVSGPDERGPPGAILPRKAPGALNAALRVHISCRRILDLSGSQGPGRGLRVAYERPGALKASAPMHAPISIPARNGAAAQHGARNVDAGRCPAEGGDAIVGRAVGFALQHLARRER